MPWREPDPVIEEILNFAAMMMAEEGRELFPWQADLIRQILADD
jgi:hypothetical protein